MANPAVQNPQREPQRGTQRLTRPVNEGRAPDMFWFDDSKRPRNMAYQWIVQTVLGEQQTQHNIKMARFHWTPVPASRHPEIAGENGGEKPIIIGGQMLCERPSYLNEESRAEEKKASMGQVNSQLERLGQTPAGTMERTRVDIERSRVPVPEDE